MADKITVKVKAMNGQQLELQVDPNIDVEEFKKLIAEKSNAAPNQQRLIYQGKVLKNGSKLSDYKIVNDHVVHLVNMPNEASSSSSSEGSSTQHQQQHRTQPSQTSSHGANQTPQTSGFRAAFGPGITVVSGMDLGGAASGGTGRIDIGSLVNNVLSGIFQPPSSTSTTTHAHSHGSTNGSNTGGTPSTSRSTRAPTSASSSHVHDILHHGREIVNFLNGNQRQSVVDDLNRLVSLLQSSASQNRRQEFIQLRQHVLPNLLQLQSNLNLIISSLNGRASTHGTNNVSARENSGAAITNVNLHLHVNSNELDTLPNQLQRLHSMINASPLAPRNGHLERPVSVTSTTEPISNTDFVNELFPSSRSSTPQTSNSVTSTSPSTQPSSTTQSTTSLHSLINNVMGAFGVSQTQESESERGFFDRLISVATDSLQLPDLFSVMSGNWTPLDATKEKLKAFLINEGLQNDSSKQSRQRKIEELMVEFEKYLDQNHDLQLEIASRANNESDVLGQLVELARFYITMLFDLILEDVSMYPQITNGVITSSSFSAALNRFTTLFLGETVELFETECISGSSKILIPLLLDSMFKALPNSVQTFYRNQGGSLISSFAERRHQEYKTQFPNRPISRMPKPVLKKVQEPSNKEEKPITTTIPSTSSSSSVVPPQSDSDKLLEELMSKDAMDLLEDVISTKVDTKPSSVATSTDSSRSATPVATMPTATTANDDWKKGLSEDEVKEINDTIHQDEVMMELNENDRPKLSDAYKLSSTIESQQHNQDISKKRKSHPNPPQEEQENSTKKTKKM
ncbi:hypothetical protein C9374_000878 [Naegleria lovaniensis]|uniref:Ubiquitin-like domain-containing protein n=1 Tax=Naegleria lovaniensis TaxID=51637 RepID=A0AA88KMX4_NAELO|nr:uncharacterized protein C9374_000878 [Naegleria lovaniensis]KAG2388028.1 hypothetical protein C9374_000878 [Naegleria lovaniensis]